MTLWFSLQELKRGARCAACIFSTTDYGQMMDKYLTLQLKFLSQTQIDIPNLSLFVEMMMVD